MERRGLAVERRGKVSKSAVYIYLRSILTAGVPGSTFFIGFNPDVREILIHSFERFGY